VGPQDISAAVHACSNKQALVAIAHISNGCPLLAASTAVCTDSRNQQSRAHQVLATSTHSQESLSITSHATWHHLYIVFITIIPSLPCVTATHINGLQT
jgi:hypothetical protein